MGLFKIIAIFMLSSPLFGVESGRILYLIRQGHFQSGIDLYEKNVEETGCHDYSLLQQIGLTLLDLGWKSNDKEIQLLTLFGAGISAHDQAAAILEQAINSSEPRFQLVAINFLSRNYTDNAGRFLNHAMRSDFLPIRLEAAFHLAQKQHQKAALQIESLMYKVPPTALPAFPQLLGMTGDRDAIAILRRLMSHPSLPVRVAAILSSAKNGRDDLLPEIRAMSHHHQVEEQEAACVALGMLKDEASEKKLRELSHSSSSSVKLAALQALYRLGREDTAPQIIEMACIGNLYAATILAEVADSEDTLFKLCGSDEINLRINAALSLLERRDPRCLPFLHELFIKDPRDLALSQTTSMGTGLTAYKIIPSALQNLKSTPVAYELTLNLKEQSLIKTLELPEKHFIEFADLVFTSGQTDLVPVLCRLLEDLRTPEAIRLLKVNRERIGAPLVRNWCNLALYRIRENGPYHDNLKAWLNNHQCHDLIQFRTLLPWEIRGSASTPYQLTPQETSRLLVETFETFAQLQDEEGISLMLNAIKEGNRKNRYAIAGLLIRATN
jgi:hypothetical protein